MISDLNLTEAREALHLFYPNFNLPNVNGHLDLDINAQAERGRDVQFNSLIKGQNTSIEKFNIGDFEGKIQYAKSTIKASEFKLQNSSGRAHLENVTVQETSDKKFSARVGLDGIELRHFLDNIDIRDVPLHMDVTGTVPCEGTLAPFVIQCAGTVEGKNFEVWTPSKKT